MKYSNCNGFGGDGGRGGVNVLSAFDGGGVAVAFDVAYTVAVAVAVADDVALTGRVVGSGNECSL